MTGPLSAECADRAAQLVQEELAHNHRQRDRLFVWLMAVQWLLGLFLALVCSPLAWSGKLHSTHLHVYYAVFVGGALSGSVILLATLRPGAVVTRHAAAVAQILWSALLIHLTGGRIETHFHVFGSLAFLAFYRDKRVLITATVVVVFDHLLRGLFWSESVYGIVNPEWWRFLEHAFWVLFENIVLWMAIGENLRQGRALALRQAELEFVNANIERVVELRTRELEHSWEQFRSLVETTRTVPWQFDLASRRFTYVGAHAGSILGCATEAWLAPGFWDARVHPDDGPRMLTRWQALRDAGAPVELEYRLKRDDGSWAWVRNLVSYGESDQTLKGFLFDITERRTMELELQQAQKLEAVGRLAAGIAHEINTPMQFVGDSIHYVRGAVDDLLRLIGRYRELARAQPLSPAQLADFERAEAATDLAYLVDNVPRALAESTNGLERVTTLVRSLKEFAHPAQQLPLHSDLNRALATTLTIACNEYKYVADVVTRFGELPPVCCHVGQLNQAFLNIIANAAHAIGDVVKGTGQRGRIEVVTVREGDEVVISIADTGHGIPDAIRAQVFEPFFTTKDVGKGSGQGLTIARSVVVDRHGGALTFHGEPGRGTTFVIRLPIEGKPVAARPQAARHHAA